MRDSKLLEKSVGKQTAMKMIQSYGDVQKCIKEQFLKESGESRRRDSNEKLNFFLYQILVNLKMGTNEEL